MEKRRGRPIVKDKRKNQYRVLMNAVEDRMLAYCSRLTGLPKSQNPIFALPFYTPKYSAISCMRALCCTWNGQRLSQCPHCTQSEARVPSVM